MIDKNTCCIPHLPTYLPTYTLLLSNVIMLLLLLLLLSNVIMQYVETHTHTHTAKTYLYIILSTEALCISYIIYHA